MRATRWPRPATNIAANTALRDGTVDLETGVLGANMGPELRTQALFRDRWVGVLCPGHPLAMAGAALTPEAFARSRRVVASRRGVLGGPVDEALASMGLERNVAAIAGGFVGALALARGTDLVACVPERHTENLRGGLHTFALPFATPELSIAMFWHPRFQRDGGHGWFRGVVGEVCSGACFAKTDV